MNKLIKNTPPASSPHTQLSTITHHSHDRAYSYDNVGRLMTAYSGVDAHSYNNDTNPTIGQGPYRHSFTYDGWSNTQTVTSRYWNRNNEVNAETFNTRNRNSNWTYDAQGNVISRNEPFDDGHTLPMRLRFDAAGRVINQSQQTGYAWFNGVTTIQVIIQTSNTETYDGDGTLVRYVEQRTTDSTPQEAETTYYLTSTVMGGMLISEYNAAGTWQSGSVYAGPELIGELQPTRSVWRHTNPVTGDEDNSLANRFRLSATVQDPLGANVAGADPFPADGSRQPDGIREEDPTIPSGIDTWWPHPMAGHRVTCEIDGIVVDCDFARSLANRGALAPCPRNDCGPRAIDFDFKLKDGSHLRRTLLTSSFQAFADGEEGFIDPLFGELLPDDFSVTMSGDQLKSVSSGLIQGSLGMNFQAPTTVKKKKKKRRARIQKPVVVPTGPLGGYLPAPQNSLGVEGVLTMKARCADLRELLKREQQHGTATAALMSSNAFGSKPLAHLNNDQGTVVVRGSPIDQDWLIDLSISHDAMMQSIDIQYVTSKSLWWVATKLGFGRTKSLPYQDLDERNAVTLAAHRFKFKDIFTKEFMNDVCYGR